jgi:membrane-associated protein
MHSLTSFFHFDLTSFLLAAGYIGLFAGVFAETGLLIGLVLPGGETLIFTAAILAAAGYFNIWAAMLISFVAAVIADSTEYAFGKKYGPRVFVKEGSRLFDKEHIVRAREFFAHYGPKTVVIARFLPFIRTLAPAFAGVGDMGYAQFVVYNIAGALIWVPAMAAAGYWLGAAFPRADQWLAAGVVFIAALSTLGSWFAVQRHRKR